MATLTIRNLDDRVHDALRRRAAGNRRSMEAEVRAILEEEYGHDRTRLSPQEFLEAIKALNKDRLADDPPWSELHRAESRLDVLLEEGLITPEQKVEWEDRLSRKDVTPAEVEGFYESVWPWRT